VPSTSARGPSSEDVAPRSAGLGAAGAAAGSLQGLWDPHRPELLLALALLLLAAVGIIACMLLRRKAKAYMKPGRGGHRQISRAQSHRDEPKQPLREQAPAAEPAPRETGGPPAGDPRGIVAASKQAAEVMRHMRSGRGEQGQQLDMITVVPEGILVTPLNGAPPPGNVPVLSPQSSDAALGLAPPSPGGAAGAQAALLTPALTPTVPAPGALARRSTVAVAQMQQPVRRLYTPVPRQAPLAEPVVGR